MTVFLILAPYGAFSLLMLVTSATLSLFAAAAICIAVMVLDFVRGRATKILAVGSAVTFAGLGTYLVFIDPALSASAVRLATDGGIFLLSLGSMLVRRPFTLQY